MRTTAHSRPASSLTSTSQTAVVRPPWRRVATACSTPSVAGPGNDDTDEFLDWLQTYQRVAITLDDEGAKEPGKVILSGDLPTAAAGG